jgi:hypothetical protein
METFSLLDDQHQSNLRTDLSLDAIFKTRLVRVDCQSRLFKDPLQEKIHKLLRNFRHWRISRQSTADIENPSSSTAPASTLRATYQDNNYLAEWFARFIVALVAGLFLIIPLTILSFQSKKSSQLATISISIAFFSFVTSIIMKSANFQTMATVAAYAAVVSVFVSGRPST